MRQREADVVEITSQYAKHMSTKEHIVHHAGDPDAWICLCRNEPTDYGFYPCNEQGEEVEPVSGWGGLYVCNRCGRIIHPDTLEVVGKAAGYGNPTPTVS